MVGRRMPSRSAASIWLRIRASSGETIRVGPRPAIAQDARGDEVDGALAPSGALHDEQPLAAVDQRIDGFPLPVAKRGVAVGEGAPQESERRQAIGYHRPGSDSLSLPQCLMRGSPPSSGTEPLSATAGRACVGRDTLGGRASSPAIFLAANVAFAISRNGGRGRRPPREPPRSRRCLFHMRLPCFTGRTRPTGPLARGGLASGSRASELAICKVGTGLIPARCPRPGDAALVAAGYGMAVVVLVRTVRAGISADLDTNEFHPMAEIILFHRRHTGRRATVQRPGGEALSTERGSSGPAQVCQLSRTARLPGRREFELSAANFTFRNCLPTGGATGGSQCCPPADRRIAP